MVSAFGFCWWRKPLNVKEFAEASERFLKKAEAQIRQTEGKYNDNLIERLKQLGEVRAVTNQLIAVANEIAQTHNTR